MISATGDKEKQWWDYLQGLVSFILGTESLNSNVQQFHQYQQKRNLSPQFIKHKQDMTL